MRPEEIISDEEVERVHGNANFGPRTKRQVIAEGVLKYAFGFSAGHTMMSILIEHGLIRTPRPGKYSSTLTKRGQRYLHSMMGNTRVADILDFMERSPNA